MKIEKLESNFVGGPNSTGYWKEPNYEIMKIVDAVNQLIEAHNAQEKPEEPNKVCTGKMVSCSTCQTPYCDGCFSACPNCKPQEKPECKHEWIKDCCGPNKGHTGNCWWTCKKCGLS